MVSFDPARSGLESGAWIDGYDILRISLPL